MFTLEKKLNIAKINYVCNMNIIKKLKTNNSSNKIKIEVFVLICLMFLSVFNTSAQSKTNKFGFNIGGAIQHYNGNLGNSVLKFNTTCFAGVSSTFGIYINKSFDFNVGNSIGHFGYCPTEKDNQRAVAYELRCPGEECSEFTGMGNLRSLLISSNVSMRYKINNGYLLSEKSKIAPYANFGFGINRLTDNMKKNCVNEGNQFSINGGVGLKFYITEKINIGYNMDYTMFMTNKVYLTNSTSNHTETSNIDPQTHKMEKRKDLCLRNIFFVGLDF
jgi:hypothetical protein